MFLVEDPTRPFGGAVGHSPENDLRDLKAGLAKAGRLISKVVVVGRRLSVSIDTHRVYSMCVTVDIAE